MSEFSTPPSLAEIERRVCDVVAKHTGVDRRELHLDLTILGDLGMDSLALIELVMELEEAFDVRLPDKPENPVCKQVFTRAPFRIRDLAETIYLQSQAGYLERSEWTKASEKLRPGAKALFTQLGGVASDAARDQQDLYDPLGENDQGFALFRRQTDGMQCVLVPSATVEIGAAEDGAHADEQPLHEVKLDAFLIDVEPVSTTAFARFLNSISIANSETLGRWFVLAPGDRRVEHAPIKKRGSVWEPVRGTEQWPVVLVSWYGANAYSLWANGLDWRDDATDLSCLPSEAQWEYAARGATRRRFPWGDEDATPERARVACHRWRQRYSLQDLPLADVNEQLGLSPFGLRHMAGNVWHWCRDDYDPAFYAADTARQTNAVCRGSTGVKSERGGSWIGPADLARSSYRRGRPPLARGRCLGFRCVGSLTAC